MAAGQSFWCQISFRPPAVAVQSTGSFELESHQPMAEASVHDLPSGLVPSVTPPAVKPAQMCWADRAWSGLVPSVSSLSSWLVHGGCCWSGSHGHQ